MSGERRFDLVCLGRAAVDLYGEQLGSPLEDVQTFKKSLGGCAGNIAVGTARLGMRTAMLTRVGDEAMGRFVREQLRREGVDVSHVVTDPTRLTGLVLLSIRDQDTFPLIFYRENCADLGLEEADFDQAFIGSARALLVTGTHLSRPASARVALRAVELARAAGTKVVLDVDYRPVLWGVTGHGRGEDRFVAAAAVTMVLRQVLPLCDLVVGTEEEIHIAGGTSDTLEALRTIRAVASAPIVMKRGPKGCAVFEGEIPSPIERGLLVDGFPIKVLNVLGAGDAFLSGLLYGWLRGEGFAAAGRYGNAAGALVVTRHGCSPEMPSLAELRAFMAQQPTPARPDDVAEVRRLHRLVNRYGQWPELCVLAFDHRSQLEELAAKAGASPGRLAPLKRLLARAGQETSKRLGLQGRLGFLIDGRHGEDALAEQTGRGVWLARPVEKPRTSPSMPPVELEVGPDLGLALRTWPTEQVVKCLAFPDPDALDAPGLLDTLRLVQAAARDTGHELLLEIIPKKGAGPPLPATLPSVLERLYREGLCPDWWKLPPLPRAEAWREVDGVIAANDAGCRGVLVLGNEAPIEQLAQDFRRTAGARSVKGFAVGRSIFAAPSSAWLSGGLGDDGLVAEVSAGFEALCKAWSNRGS